MKNKMIIQLAVIVSFGLLLTIHDAVSQNVAINADGSQPHASAILDLQAANKGLLIPRMDMEHRDAIIDPAAGLLIYQTGNDDGFRYFDGVAWRSIERPLTNSVADTDGNVYDIILIGTQQWFAQNLKVSHFRNGDPIPILGEAAAWAGTSGAALTAYNGMPGTYVPEYGLLYNAFSVNDPRGLCPEGWKVPGWNDWQELFDYVGLQPGGHLKTLNGWEIPNEGATNTSGFSAIPAGQRAEDGLFGMLRYHAAFWSESNEGNNNQAVLLKHYSSEFHLETRPARQGLSVRCIKKQP